MQTPERSVPRYREGDPEPEGAPAPTQARADFIKARTHGAGPDDVPALAPPQVKDVPLVYGPGSEGAAVVGDILHCTMGNWTGEPTYTYQWKRDATNVGSNSGNYTVIVDDSGHAISCVVTATNAEGSTAAPPSNAITIP
ncbi:MAG TPA: hypothetical protein VEW06_06525 [Xanthobacteraceae bacterium]|nr:hypothetical protein [Xanthobacteraceae bacterium]